VRSGRLRFSAAALALQANYQEHRIGSTLIECGMQQLSALSVNVVFVYGDPEYYERFGINVEAARDYTPPFKLQYSSGRQGIVLDEYAMEKASVAKTFVAPLHDPKLW